MAYPANNPFALLADDASAAPSKPKQQAAAPSPSLEAQKTPAERAAARANQPAPRKKPAKQAPVSDDGFEVVRRGKDHAHKADTAKEAPAKEGRREAPQARQAPARGRPKDRESGSKISRKPPPKKGGAGKGNLGKPTPQTEGSVDSVLDEINADVPPRDEVKDVPAGEDTGASADTAAETPAEPEDKTLGFNEFLRIRQQEAEALKAKVGEIAPRKVDASDIDKFIAPKTETPAAGAKDAAPAARKGTKLVDASQFFTIKTAPTEESRGGRGRGRGRGGRGRGGRDNDAPRSSGASTGGRGGRGGRGGSRGGSGGDRGSRGRSIDTNSTKQFPTLG